VARQQDDDKRQGKGTKSDSEKYLAGCPSPIGW